MTAATSKSPVSLSLEGGIARISIDDGKANAINAHLLGDLDAALDQAAQANAAVLIAGRPGVFSGGLDTKTLPNLEAPALEHALDLFAKVVLRVFLYPRPVVVAATGHSVAGGAALMLAGDERIGTEGPFRVGLNETAVGLPLPAFIVEIAECALPRTSLQRVVVAGDLAAPGDAVRLGLLDVALPSEQVFPRALERAQALAQLPASAYAANKLALRAERGARGQARWKQETVSFIEGFLALRRPRAQI